MLRSMRGTGRWAHLLLLLPFVGLLYPPFYARLEPRLSGVPFFIWYQFAWIAGGALVMIVAYRLIGDRGDV
jgi:Protein of unknown function (DUF3311)